MKIPTSVIRVAGNALSTIKKYSPQIMMAIGTISSVAAVVEAVKQTPKAMDILEAHKKDKDSIEAARAEYPEEYSEQEYKKELVALYARTGAGLAKTYAMPVIMEAASLMCFHGAHRIMNNRNKVLAASLATMTNAYNDYRNKMIEELGEEKEEQIRLGLDTEKEIVETVDEVTGKKKKKTTPVNVFYMGKSKLGPWDFLWGENDYNYDQSENINETTLRNIFGNATRALYVDHRKGKMSIADIIGDRLISKDDLYEQYPNFVNNGYTQDNADKGVYPKQRSVKIYNEDGSTFRYGMILTFNGDGPVVG